MKEIVICNSIGSYSGALTRGKEYVVIEENKEKEQIRIVDDNNRTRWYKKYYFVPHGTSVPVLAKWKFDDEIIDSSEKSLEHIEVTFTFSDGQRRWCSICTKQGLKDYVERNMDGNVLLIENQIIVKDFSYEIVNRAFFDLDQQNELLNASLLYN
ncbi:hypothetical protein [Lysinibacillus sp. NPDC056185]|uniref:hypothetical protein n=1 Tax=Lysinibacillus sp. NPDC056185 TaxID=3345739 RepID=UPI0039EF7482